MAEQYGYFNGLAYDEDFPAQRIAALVPNGVYQNGSQVLAGGSMKLQVTPGRAWINGYFYRSDEAVEVTVPTAHPSLPRKDAVVLRWDLPEKVMGVCVVEGTPANNPQPPALRRDSQVYDLQLALVKVETGAIALTQSAVQDTRTDKAVCGYTQGFDQMDFSQLMAQLDAWAEEYRTGKNEEFQGWFDTIKDQLTDNVAGSLQAQINQITESKGQPGGIAGQDALQALADSRGQADGIATLDGAGKLAQMPTAGDVGADAAGSAAAVQTALGSHTGNKQNPHGVTAAQVGAALAGHTHTAAQVGAAPSSHTHTAAQVGARPSSWMPTLGDLGIRFGTWTPKAKGWTLASSSKGYYAKIGRWVHLSFDLAITGRSGTDSVVINNLPFSPASTSAGSVSYYNFGVYANGSTSSPFSALSTCIYSGDSGFYFVGNYAERSWRVAAHEGLGISGTVELVGSISYLTDD